MAEHYDVILQCSDCKRPYGFRSGGGGPMQDRETWRCPHCGSEQGEEKTGGVPSTHKLTPTEEAAWKRGQKS